MTTSTLLFHVGYHKTATTWLQNTVFQPEHGFTQILDHPEIFKTIVNPHGLQFEAGKSRALIAERVKAAPDSSANVVSLESLSGSPFSGGRESDDFARRIAEISPGAKILITIREQCRIIASVYMQYLSRGGTEPAEQFFSGSKVEAFHGFEARNFEYDRLVALYQSLFGAENVLVLPFETIARDQATALGILGKFIQNPNLATWENRPPRAVSYPEIAVPVLRRINHFRPSPLNRAPFLNLGRAGEFSYRVAGGGVRRIFRTKNRPVTNLAVEKFSGQFRDSNRRLQAMLAHPVDLSAYQGIED